MSHRSAWGHVGKDGVVLFSLVRGSITIKRGFGKKFQVFLTPDTARPPCSWRSTHFVLFLVSLGNFCARGGPEHGKGLRCLVFNEKQKRLDCSKVFNYEDIAALAASFASPWGKCQITCHLRGHIFCSFQSSYNGSS